MEEIVSLNIKLENTMGTLERCDFKDKHVQPQRAGVDARVPAGRSEQQRVLTAQQK